MNTKKKREPLLEDTRALSEVVGLVLILAILLSVASIYISQQVPELTKDFEARHTEDVVDDFSELDSLVDGIVLVAKLEEVTAGATATKSIRMAPDRVPLFGMSPPGSILSFSPYEEELFTILPYTGNGSPPAPYNGTIEESTTADFLNGTKIVNVDVSFDEIKLLKQGSGGNLILDGNSITLSGEYYYNLVQLTNGSWIDMIPGNFLKIHANSVYIDATSTIFGDARGYAGGIGGVAGTGPGFGYEAYNGSGGGGAGHNDTGGPGGLGGLAIPGDEGAGGQSYGDNSSYTINLGSGGGGGAYGDAFQGQPFEGYAGGPGGWGGGAIMLDAANIIFAGTINADGTDGTAGTDSKTSAGGGGGGGSGGNIIIIGRAVNLSLSTLSANGGAGGAGGEGGSPGRTGGGGGGGGSGGWIKIYYENSSLYTPSTNYSVGGGAGGLGGAGALYPGATGANGPFGEFFENQTIYSTSIPHETFGYYESRVYDTGFSTTCYGNITWDATTSEYTSLVLKVRTSISPNMTGAALWENCPAVANGQDISELSSAFNWHRYIQYRAELFTYESSTTPVLRSVSINYSSFCPTGEGDDNVVDSANGMIQFRSGYIYYPNQEIVYEHGAVLRSQTIGDEKRGFVISDPPITIGTDNATGAPLLQISMIDLTGSNYSYAGPKSTTVEKSGTDYAHLAGTIAFDNLSLTMATAYPLIWSNWFNQTLGESGLDAPYYSPPIINESAGTVVVEFYGQGDGVQLYEEKTTVHVQITT